MYPIMGTYKYDSILIGDCYDGSRFRRIIGTEMIFMICAESKYGISYTGCVFFVG